LLQVLEINPRHPFIVKLLEGCPPEKEEEDAEPFVISPEAEDAAWLLLDMGSMNGGFPIADPEAHGKRMTKYLQNSLGVKSLDLEAEIDPPEEEEEAPDIDMDDFAGLNMEDFDMDSLNLD
jgi:hypothetical protein